MEDFEGNQRYAEYKNFRVDDEMVKHGWEGSFPTLTERRII